MFVDAQSRVDREGLRNYVVAQLITMRQQATALCTDYHAFWDKAELIARKQLLEQEREKVISVFAQLRQLPEYIDMWMETAVDTPERFDFFVLAKAHELKSGDQQKDYFWAIQIRHDQLVALVRVLDLLLDKMKLWVTLRPDKILEDPVFAGLTTYGVEDQVYMEAERVYTERQRMSGVAS